MEQLYSQLNQNIFSSSANRSSWFHQSFNFKSPNLEAIKTYYFQGCNIALKGANPTRLDQWLVTIPPEFAGFAAEGISTGLTILDYATPWRRYRLQAFLTGPGAPHIYMACAGAGLAFAWFHHFSRWPLDLLDSILRWFVFDGYGFNEGVINWDLYGKKQARPITLVGYEYRAFDHGLGRSIWFKMDADVTQIPHTIKTFDHTRQGDLWKGVGIACSLAGGVTRPAIETLKSAAGPYQSRLAQGAVCAAHARQVGGNPVEHTDLACRILCGMPAEDAANIALTALDNLPPDGNNPAYEIWMQRIEAKFKCV